MLILDQSERGHAEHLTLTLAHSRNQLVLELHEVTRQDSSQFPLFIVSSLLRWFVHRFLPFLAC